MTTYEEAKYKLNEIQKGNNVDGIGPVVEPATYCSFELDGSTIQLRYNHETWGANSKGLQIREIVYREGNMTFNPPMIGRWADTTKEKVLNIF